MVKQWPEKSHTWATDESMYKVLWCSVASWRLHLMHIRPDLTGKTWKTTVDKLILVITNKDREACVSTDQTFMEMSWVETSQLLLFDQQFTQWMKIGLCDKFALENLSVSRETWRYRWDFSLGLPSCRYIFVFVSTTCVSVITDYNFVKVEWSPAQ